ncbi:MAG: hypothetical protein ABIL68_10870 [bacterium]
MFRIVFLAVILCLTFQSLAQTTTDDPLKTAEGLIKEIYNAVSLRPGVTLDWERVKSFFIKEAVVVIRTSRIATSVFSVEGFVQDFINFYANYPGANKGFTETILNMKSVVFGDMASILVLYEAHITGSPRPPEKGVDSWLLIQKDDRWWITAVTNEIVSPERPVPKELQ